MKFLLLPVLFILAIEATLANASLPAADLQEYYITGAGCRIYEKNSLGKNDEYVEVWLFLSKTSREYTAMDPNGDEVRAGMELENNLASRRKCEELYQIYRSGQKGMFEVASKDIHGTLKIRDFSPIFTGNFSSRRYDELGTNEPSHNYSEENLKEDVIKPENSKQPKEVKLHVSMTPITTK